MSKKLQSIKGFYDVFTLKGDNIANEFKAIVMNYVESHYSKLK